MRVFRVTRRGEFDSEGVCIKDSAIYCLVGAKDSCEAEDAARKAHLGWANASLSVLEVSSTPPIIIDTKYLP